MSQQRRFVLLTQPEDLPRIQSLADALAGECLAQQLDWQVIIATGAEANAPRKAFVVTDSQRQRSHLRKWLKRHKRIPSCALVFDAQPISLSGVTSFDVSQWPGRDADAALDALVRWLACADADLLEAPETIRAYKWAWLAGLLGLLCVALFLRFAATAPATSVVPVDPRLASNPEYSRDGPDGNVDYEAGLISRGLYTGIELRQWRRADELVERALWQDPDDANVAASAARYYLLRGAFERAEELLGAHEGALPSRDAALLDRLRSPSEPQRSHVQQSLDQQALDPLTHWCVQAAQDPTAGYESARQLVAAGQLSRATLLDSLCVLERVYAGRDDRLQTLLGLTDAPSP